MSESATLIPETTAAPTPLANLLQGESPHLTLRMHAGALTPGNFSSTDEEIAAAATGVAIFDSGYRTRIRVTGEDRLRWLNGMVSNAVQTLPEGSGNYNFILNAQGRIQGDAYIYRTSDSLLLDTDRSQAARLLAHLDHFIIMDDVELRPLDEVTSGIGLAGPQAAAMLDSLGLSASGLAPLQFVETSIAGHAVTLLHAYSPLIPRYEIWFSPDHTAALWKSLIAAGAKPIGIETLESLRVLEGIPRYGIDFNDRYLAQETSQTRALNFTKGCYLGQEIVERIRSRATVHRYLRQLELHGETPTAPTDILAAGDTSSLGQLTSIAAIRLPGLSATLALGFIRTEALERKASLEYTGGMATVLDHLPALPRS
ncbi:YgfZ/GcvT domain-containing protein [Acidisarcina polymorpha]|nr:folate-binding protein YgfZ [Acidisarcina polymorpha]